jgi:hypothetical protein
MPQSLSRVVVHGVFSTKNRTPQLTPELLKELSAYLTTVLAKQGHTQYFESKGMGIEAEIGFSC